MFFFFCLCSPRSNISQKLNICKKVPNSVSFTIAQWLELILVITLHYTEYSITLVSTSLISLTYPKGLQKTYSEEWSMILHTTSDNFVILEHRRRKGNGKKSNTDHFRLPYGHMLPFQERNSRQNIKNDKAIGLFCWSVLLKY